MRLPERLQNRWTYGVVAMLASQLPGLVMWLTFGGARLDNAVIAQLPSQAVLAVCAALAALVLFPRRARTRPRMALCGIAVTAVAAIFTFAFIALSDVESAQQFWPKDLADFSLLILSAVVVFLLSMVVYTATTFGTALVVGPLVSQLFVSESFPASAPPAPPPT